MKLGLDGEFFTPIFFTYALILILGAIHRDLQIKFVAPHNKCNLGPQMSLCTNARHSNLLCIQSLWC